SAAVNHFHKLSDNAYRNLAPKIPGVRDWIIDRVKDQAHVEAARRRLVEYGLAGNLVRQFPALQVVLLDGKLAYEVRRDETMKLMTLPYWQVDSLFANTGKLEEGLINFP